MNQPLNPVLKGTLGVPAKEPQPWGTPTSAKVPPLKGQRRVPDKLARLSMPESFALIEWLKAYKVQPGDSVKTMAVAAASALDNPKINENHVRQRMEEFGLTMPTYISHKTISVLERLATLEKVLTITIREQARMLRDLGVEPAPEVLQFLER